MLTDLHLLIEIITVFMISRSNKTRGCSSAQPISVLAGETRTFTTSISFFTTLTSSGKVQLTRTTWTNPPENSSFTNVNSPTLNVLNIQTSQDKHQFRVAVIPFCGNTVYSNAALLSVNATNTCPEIINPQ